MTRTPDSLPFPEGGKLPPEEYDDLVTLRGVALNAIRLARGLEKQAADQRAHAESLKHSYLMGYEAAYGTAPLWADDELD